MANRILDLEETQAPSSPPSAAVESVPEQVFRSGRFAVSTEGGPLALFAPVHYEPNYAYPLVVWLHGPDDNERQLLRIMPHVSLRNYMAVAPRGTVPMRKDPAWKGFCWQQSASDIAMAEQRVLEGIATAQRKYRIDPSRIFLAGYQCGGTMALRLAFQWPQRFAGVMSIGGKVPHDQRPLRELRSLRRLPVLLGFGRDAKQYAPHDACADLRLLHSAGMRVQLRQYPCDDCVTTEMLADLDRWMMERVADA
jgi:phospholipase/carboxylesterase